MKEKKGFFETSEDKSVSTGCQCEFNSEDNVIYCQRHGCMKTKHLHKLCKRTEEYFQAWENGVGPNQTLSSLQPKKRPLPPQRSQNQKEEKIKGFFMGDQEIPEESRGIGDTIAKITKATGVKKAVDVVFGAFNKDCGCKERQSKLNKMFPYKNTNKPRKTKGFFE